MACFAVLDTTTKLVTASVPALMALWVLFLVQALAIGSYVLVTRGWASLKMVQRYAAVSSAHLQNAIAKLD